MDEEGLADLQLSERENCRLNLECQRLIRDNEILTNKLTETEMSLNKERADSEETHVKLEDAVLMGRKATTKVDGLEQKVKRLSDLIKHLEGDINKLQQQKYQESENHEEDISNLQSENKNLSDRLRSSDRSRLQQSELIEGLTARQVSEATKKSVYPSSLIMEFVKDFEKLSTITKECSLQSAELAADNDRLKQQLANLTTHVLSLNRSDKSLFSFIKEQAAADNSRRHISFGSAAEIVDLRSENERLSKIIESAFGQMQRCNEQLPQLNIDLRLQ